MADRAEEVVANTPLTLGQFVKFIGWAPTGGQAKYLVESGEICVNGEIERRRGRQLHHGDKVTYADDTRIVATASERGRPADT